ncbi:MAG: DUF898 domain-containing protein [Hyphomicrobiales bacterium]|nr:DUF898 domain-containing protein [Hyphomicrobiales bacterium]
MKLHKFKFTGNAKEYFGIWIVNLFLSIITLGIYTAWAKVRRVRYFYGHTFIDGHNLEYHAKPKSILIGRIIVLGILIIMNFLVSITPLAGVLVIPYLLALPWVINQAMRFNARVTSYRNVRFNFKGTYWQALKIFFLIPLGAILGFGLVIAVLESLFGESLKSLSGLQAVISIIIYLIVLLVSAALFVSYMSKLTSNYIGNNLSFGSADFRTDAKLKPLVANYAFSLLFFVVIVAVFALAGFIAGSMFEITKLLESTQLGNTIPIGNEAYVSAIFGAFIAIYIGMFLGFLFYNAGVRNIAYRATLLDGQHQLQSSISQLQYVWIMVSNLFVTVFTIGLMRPWAAIRTWRYLADNTALLAKNDLGNIVDESTPEGAAASAEFLDIEGFDFGL